MLLGWNSTSFSCGCTAHFCYSSRSKHQSYRCEHCSIDTSEQNNVRKCVQETVPLNLGELFFINLIILSLMTLYIRASGGNQAALVYTAVGITFAQFIAIVFYHILMKRVLRQVMQQWYMKLSLHRTPDRRHIDNQQQQEVVVRQPTQSVIALHELREPLLTD